MYLRTILLVIVIAIHAYAGWLILGCPALPKPPTFWIRILHGRREVVPPEWVHLLDRR
jgi:hypothetical protein